MIKQIDIVKYWIKEVIKRPGIYLIGLFFVILTDFTQVIASRMVGWWIDFFQKKPLNFLDQSLGLLFREFSGDHFALLILLMLINYGFQWVGRVGWRLTMARQTHVQASLMKGELWESVSMMAPQDFSRFGVGHVLNVGTSDINKARYLFGFTLVGAIDIFVLLAVTFLFIAFIDWRLAALSTVLFSGLFLVIPNVLEKEGKAFSKAQERLSKLNGDIIQRLKGLRLLKALSREKEWSKKLVKESDSYRDEKIITQKQSLKILPITGIFHLLNLSVLFIAGLWLVKRGEMSVGELISFEALILATQGPLMNLTTILSDWKRGVVALGRYCDIVGTIQNESIQEMHARNVLYENDPKIIIQKGIPLFHLKEAQLWHHRSEKEALNFSLQAEEWLGVIGPVGSGKTILLKSLLKDIPLQKGDISFCGRPLSECSEVMLRDHVTLIHQKSHLFSGELSENIGFNGDFEDERLWYFLEIVQLAGEVMKLPRKLQTPLGELGVNLSGGQKQRLALARALVRQTPIYFIDDALSAVDKETEVKIIEGLKKVLAKKTVLWASSRPYHLEYCSRTFSLKEQSGEDLCLVAKLNSI
jgi:ATP-binding cassette, subfamily B, multidrug efflux pump